MNPGEKKRGRPRSREVDQAILQATLLLLQEQGYARMTIEAVAAEASVGKTAIYRRYRNKDDLATAAIARLTDVGGIPETGSAFGDLQQLLARLHRNFRSWRGMAMIGNVLVEERHNPELIRLFRERVVLPRRARIKKILQRGIESGEVRPGIDLEQVADSLIGSYFAHYLAGLPAGKEWPAQILELIKNGIAATDHA